MKTFDEFIKDGVEFPCINITEGKTVKKIKTVITDATFGTVAFKVNSGVPIDKILDDIMGYVPRDRDLIRDTGGWRKIRVADDENNKGKSGGWRAIFYYVDDDEQPSYLWIAYPKNKKESLTQKEKNKLKKLKDKIQSEIYKK